MKSSNATPGLRDRSEIMYPILLEEGGKLPTYGYKCRECSKEFEVFRKISDPPVEACPKCAGSVSRVFHPVGIIFKGSGFYSTDNKKRPAETPAAAPKPAKSEPAADKTKTEKVKTPEKAATT
jgi:putative FmdB family regulatory protein